MKHALFFVGFFAGCLALSSLSAQSLTAIEAERKQLPNGWSLTPVGKSLPLGDLPLNMVISPSQQLMAVSNNGQGVHSLQLIDPVKETILDTKVVGKAWYGLAFSKDSKKLYAAGGHDNWILVFDVVGQKLVTADTLRLGKPWPNKIAPAGIALDETKGLLYVVTRDDKSLYAVDLKSGTVVFQQSIEHEAYACVLTPDRKTLLISSWGGDAVLFFDTEAKRVKEKLAVGDNPNELLLANKGKTLYVANANDNTVSVIDVSKPQVIEVLNAALYPDAPNGSTTNGLALSKDEKTLYVANADNNCLAVFDVSKKAQSKGMGFIPTGWYPTNVKVLGNKILVSNGKGFSSQANPYGPNPFGNKQTVVYQQGDPNKPDKVQYIAGLFMGTLSIIPAPSAAQLDVYTQVVYRNTPYNKAKEVLVSGEAGNPIPRQTGAPSPIKYVFYVIKENRTYDQVLGDMPEGNGDPRLVLFGENITPNQHALAR
ncbi:MAG: hypothetical protein EAZ62_08045, partial [Sphingobacteriia bacterium]